MKVDPIIAVHNVELSSHWYQAVFGCTSIHGGDEFDVLLTKEKEVLICLHKWGAHEHPSMTDSRTTPGNGLILYFRTPDMEQVRTRLQDLEYDVAREVALNPNSHHREFSVIDPDGYYLTVSEYHKYGG